METNDLDIDQIVDEFSDTPSEPDEKTADEIRIHDAESKRLDNHSKSQDIKARKEYANKIFILISVWLSFMIIIVFLAGFGARCGWFQVSDSVLITLITTTTTSVLGLFVIVANYLFKKK